MACLVFNALVIWCSLLLTVMPLVVAGQWENMRDCGNPPYPAPHHIPGTTSHRSTRSTTTTTTGSFRTDTDRSKIRVKRVVGGVTSRECEYPWAVKISLGTRGLCGGSLLDDRHVITAAHCLELVTPSTPVSVMTGSSSLHKMFTSSVDYWVIHPNRTKADPREMFDVAMLTLSKPLPLGPCIWPICLVEENDLPDVHDSCVAAGWGSDLKHSSQIRQKKVHLPLVSGEACEASYDEKFDNTKLCAGDYMHGGIDTCQGDSGGPLMCLKEGEPYQLHGLTSFGFGCGQPFNPGVYTRVSHPIIRDFVLQVLNADINHQQ